VLRAKRLLVSVAVMTGVLVLVDGFVDDRGLGG
jgi:hypothetical protein